MCLNSRLEMAKGRVSKLKTEQQKLFSMNKRKNNWKTFQFGIGISFGIGIPKKL